MAHICLAISSPMLCLHQSRAILEDKVEKNGTSVGLTGGASRESKLPLWVRKTNLRGRSD